MRRKFAKVWIARRLTMELSALVSSVHRKSDESSPPGVLSRAATIVLHRDFHVEIPRDGTWLGIWLDRRE